MTAPHDNTPADPRVDVAREYAHADPPGRHPHLTGILLMCLGLVLINTSDAIGKLMTEELPIFEIVLFQSVGLILLAMAVARRANPLTLVATPDPWLQGLRALFQTASGLCFFAGLKVLPFADLVAILFIGPLVVSAMAHVVLGEHVGPRRWAACLVGLAGALVIVRPGMDGLGWAAIWPISGTTLVFSETAVTGSVTTGTGGFGAAASSNTSRFTARPICTRTSTPSVPHAAAEARSRSGARMVEDGVTVAVKGAYGTV